MSLRKRFQRLRFEALESRRLLIGSPTDQVLEAESGVLFGDMAVFGDTAASGGQYVSGPSGQSSPGSNYVEFEFDVQVAGNYTIETVVNGLSGGSNSFFVTVDGQPSSGYVWDVPHGVGYVADAVSDRTGAAPVVLWLSAGTHAVQFHTRERNTRLDTVSLTFLNTAPTITSDGGDATAAISVAENQTFVTTMEATDPDAPPQVLTYSITGGADQSQFSIDPATGDLNFTSPPDFESPTDVGGDNVYDVQVSVADDGTPNLSDIQDIAVTVFSSNLFAVNEVIEAESGVLFGTMVASSDTTASGGQYVSSGSNGSAPGSNYVQFDFDVVTSGNYVLETMVNGLDGGSNSFFVTVDGQPSAGYLWSVPNGVGYVADLVSDRNGSDPEILSLSAGTHVVQFHSRESDTRLDTVKLIPHNTAPTITSDGGGSTAAISVPQNQTAVTTVVATDPEAPPQVLTYSISGGDDQTSFSIAPSTGVLAFVSPPDFGAPTDVGGDNVYNVQVTVSDDGSPSLADTQDIAVTVVNTTSFAANEIIEAELGSLFGTMSISSDSAASGGQYVSSSSNASAPGSNYVQFEFDVVTAGDYVLETIVNGPSGASNSFFVTVDDQPAAGYLWDVPVNVGYVADSVADRNGSDPVVLSLSAGSHIVQFHTREQGTRLDTVSLSSLSPSNTAPTITSDGGGATAAIAVIENQTAVTTVVADDTEAPPQILTYSITGGADQTAFTIDASTGVLAFSAPPDFDSPTDVGGDNIYDVQVTVTDDGSPNLSDTQDIAVTVIKTFDVNQTIEAESGFLLGSMAIASDSAASGGQYVSSQSNASSPGNNYVQLAFDVAAADDYVLETVVNGPDGSSNSFFVTVDDQPAAGILWDVPVGAAFISDSVADRGGGGSSVFSLSAGLHLVRFHAREQGTRLDTVRLSAASALNSPPTITSDGGNATADVAVGENQISVTTVQATDPDIPAQTLSFSISGGSDQALFSIAASTGVLTFNSAPDFEAPGDSNGDNIYDVQVTVTDDGIGNLTDVQDIAVTIVDGGFAPDVTIEAEAGVLTGTMRISSDASASGGQYVESPQNYSSIGTNFVEFEFSVPAADEFMVDTVVNGTDFGSNSFFVTVDGLPSAGHIWDTPATVGYVPDEVSSRTDGDPLNLSLSAGSHVIRFHARESGTRLDSVRLSTVGSTPSVIELSVNQVTVDEEGGTAQVPLIRTGSTSGTAKAFFQTLDLEALDGQDYVGQVNGEVVFADGQTSAFATVSLINDTDLESAETFSVSLFGTEGAELGVLRTATVTILDDESGEGLVGRWQLDESAIGQAVVDSSENSNDGVHTNINAPEGPTSDAPNTQTSNPFALLLDGIDDYVSVAPNAALDLSSGRFTQSVWIKPDIQDNAPRGVLGYEGPGGSSERYPSIWVVDQSKIEVGFGDGTSFQSVTTDTALTTGEWNHVASTFDGTTYLVYVNGVEVLSSTALSGMTPVATNQLDIGRVDSYFAGTIDDVQVHNRVLSASEVGVLIDGATVPPIPIDGELTTEQIASGLNTPVEIEWLPDGRMLVAEQDGFVRIVETNGTVQPTPLLDINTIVNSSATGRGMIGFAIHPNFSLAPYTDPYIYVAYSYDPPEVIGNTGLGGPDGDGARVARISRFTVNAAGTFADPLSELVLVGNASTYANIGDPSILPGVEGPHSCVDVNDAPIEDCIPADEVSHTIGELEFGPDGMLYAASGDGGSFGRVDPINLRSLDVDSLAGKILRIDPITGQGPTDNPLYNGNPDANESKVFSYGLRNPFRFAFNDDTNPPKIFIGDVGWTQWEELNVGVGGENYGWPAFEGGSGVSLQTGGYEDLVEVQDYYATNPTVEAPVWARLHSEGARAIVMGDFVSNVYNGYHQSDLIFTDVGDRVLRTASFDAAGDFESVRVVSQTLGFIVDIETGPDGFLYYVDITGSIGRLVLV